MRSVGSHAASPIDEPALPGRSSITLPTCVSTAPRSGALGILGVLALSLLSALVMMAVPTPLGLYPSAVPGCNVAATRRLGNSFGRANAFPPPRYLLDGRATRVHTKSAALASVLLRAFTGLVLRETKLMPLRRPLSAAALELLLRGCAMLFQCLRHHHP